MNDINYLVNYNYYQDFVSINMARDIDEVSARNLLRIRLKHRLSQGALAKLIRSSYVTLAAIESYTAHRYNIF